MSLLLIATVPITEKRPAEDTTEGSPVKKAKISEEEAAPVAEEASA